MAQFSQFGLRLKAWLSHYGSCQKDFATSHVTEAFGQCHYPAKCWPLITQMSAKNGPKVSLGLTQDKREMTAFNSSQRGDVFVKTWSFVKIQQWQRAKCSMSQMWQRWNAIQACEAAVTCVSFKAFDPLFMSNWTKITPTLLKTFFFLDSLEKKKFLHLSWVVKDHHTPEGTASRKTGVPISPLNPHCS